MRRTLNGYISFSSWTEHEANVLALLNHYVPDCLRSLLTAYGRTPIREDGRHNRLALAIAHWQGDGVGGRTMGRLSAESVDNKAYARAVLAHVLRYSSTVRMSEDRLFELCDIYYAHGVGAMIARYEETREQA